ncbi:hypothetical protein [Thalassospira sp.]|uniref:hypothetical protein n=1 Tax=Thalassospira sp. TaxID=1912094 RepID=UPI000C357697|nr:hypothetical protein [Thalassospira sp.]MBC07207.1 hypothetical protein [Thalassospira sp.]|tara:strand:- start:1000 stop:1248 length:249 start_codon:yes stop_codon:yes gene_type:complete
MKMAAPFYALARLRPAVVKLDRVAVIPAAIYVTYTLCGDKELIAKISRKVKKTAVWSSFKISRKMRVWSVLQRRISKLLMQL